MSAQILLTPRAPFASHGEAGTHVANRVQAWLAWPKRWWEAHRAPDWRAELGEREWHDVGTGPRDPGFGYAGDETADEKALRRRAVRAWYGDLRPPTH